MPNLNAKLILICGLPRCGNQWLAAFLDSDENRVFLEPLKTKTIPQLKGDIIASESEYVTVIDPTLPFWYGQLDLDPDKILYLSRPTPEVAASYNALMARNPDVNFGHRPGAVSKALDGLADKFALMMDELPGDYIAAKPGATFWIQEKLKVQDMWTNLFGSRPFPEDRYELFKRFRVDTYAEAYDGAEVVHASEQISGQQASQEVLLEDQQIAMAVDEMCKGAQGAALWLGQLWECASLWDHLVDGDPYTHAQVDKAFETMWISWPSNPFWTKWAPMLLPTISSAISAWKASNDRIHGKCKAYDIYTEVASAVAFLIGGQRQVEFHMPKLRSLVEKRFEKDELLDEGKL